MKVLAIESSTSSAKAVLYDTEKGIIASRQEAYGPEIDSGGMTDPEAVFELTMRMGREAAAGADVSAIALCGTFHSICALDGSMKPVTKVYSWNYTGSTQMCGMVRSRRDLRDNLYHRTGCMPHNTYPRDTIRYLREEGFELAGKKFITQGAYNLFRITGEFVETVSTQSGSGLINLKTRDYDPFVLEYLGIDRDQLGELADYTRTLPLSREGAEKLGLKEGIPVVPAHPDGALNQVGSNAQKRGIMTLSVGTSAALRVVTDAPVLPDGNELWCYCGVEGWLSGAATAGACSCVNWFADDLLSGRLSYEELEGDEDFERDMPVFLPFLYGERCPGWNDDRRGGFFCLEGGTDLPDLYRAIQMGIIFNLKQCYSVLCRYGGAPDRIIVSGGIVNSSRWLGMVSDILRREIMVAEYPNASSMGAVALALHASGALERLEDFSAGAGAVKRIAPNKNRYEYYDRQYIRYLEAYGAASSL